MIPTVRVTSMPTAMKIRASVMAFDVTNGEPSTSPVAAEPMGRTYEKADRPEMTKIQSAA